MAQAAEPGQLGNPNSAVNANPVDVSPAWRKLADQYKSQIDALRVKRNDKKADQDRIQERLNNIDIGDIIDNSQEEVKDSAEEVIKSAGNAGKEYFDDFGEVGGILGAGKTILTETLPALKKEIDAEYRPIDAMYDQERLQESVNHLDNDINKIDKDVAAAQRNMDLSNEAAAIYSQQTSQTQARRQEIVFRLVDKSKKINETAATNIQHHLDTIPAGWVACTCPAVHRALGRYIKGVLYHPDGVTCPR